MRQMKNQDRKVADHGGSTFDSFLENEGTREEVDAVAIKRVLAWQFDTRRSGRRLREFGIPSRRNMTRNHCS